MRRLLTRLRCCCTAAPSARGSKCAARFPLFFLFFGARPAEIELPRILPAAAGGFLCAAAAAAHRSAAARVSCLRQWRCANLAQRPTLSVPIAAFGMRLHAAPCELNNN